MVYINLVQNGKGFLDIRVRIGKTGGSWVVLWGGELTKLVPVSVL